MAAGNDLTRGIRVYLDTAQFSAEMKAATDQVAKYGAEVNALSTRYKHQQAYAKGLQSQYAALNKELTRLERRGKGQSARAEEIRKRMTSLSTALAGVNKRIPDTRVQLERATKVLNKATAVEQKYQSELKETAAVLNNLSGSSYNQLMRARNSIRSQLQQLSPQSAEYRQSLVALTQTEARLSVVTGELNGRANMQRSLFSKLSSVLNKYFLMLSTTLMSFMSAVQAGRRAVQAYGEVDERLAFIRKYAGLSKDEVRDLNAALQDVGNINTRTAHTSLLELAADAGKLGIKGVDDLTRFVKAADMIKLSLGEDLGEDAVKNIGKLANLFGEDKRLGLDTAMLSTASAVTKLAKSSTAAEPYLVEFAGRMGGIGAAARIGTSDILGLGSALDQNMQKVEMSSTAISTVLVKMVAEPAKFARIAKLDVASFTDLVHRDLNEALLQFLEAMGKVRGGFDEMVPMFGDMQMNGKRAVQVLTSLATHTDQVRQAQAIANAAYNENVEVMKEFDVMNSTVQAKMEKRKKHIQQLRVELGEKLMPVVSHIYTTSSLLVRMLLQLVSFIGRYQSTILALTLVLAGYRLQLQYDIITEKLHTAVLWLKNTAVKTLTASVKKLWAAFKANPLGIVIAALTVLNGLIQDHNRRVKERIELQRTLQRTEERARTKVDDEIQHMVRLLNLAKDENLAKHDRLIALQKLNDIAPAYFGNLKLETLHTEEAKKAVADYIRMLQLESQIKEQIAERDELRERARALDRKIDDPTWSDRLKGWWRSLYSANLFDKDSMKKLVNNTMGYWGMQTGLKNLDPKVDAERRALWDQVVKLTLALDKSQEELLSVLRTQPAALDYPDDDGDDYGGPEPMSPLDTLKDEYEGEGGVFETLKQYYEEMKDDLDRSLAEREITQQQYNVRLASLQQTFYGQMEEAYGRYYDALGAVDFKKQKDRERALAKAMKGVLTNRNKGQNAANRMVDYLYDYGADDMRKSLGKLSDRTDPLDAVNQKYEATKKLLHDVAVAAQEANAELNGKDTKEYLEKQALINMNLKESVRQLDEWYAKQKDDIELNASLRALRQEDRVMSKFREESIRSRYDLEREELRLYLQYEKITREQYERMMTKVRLAEIQDYYSRVSAVANAAFSSLQEAEVAAVEAKYEVLLRAAENNGEDTAALEAEYANRKLEVQKQYAALNFAMKLSQITADTAVAAMKVRADLGFPAGDVMAGIYAIAGAAQYATAYAEYQKIRNMSYQTAVSPTMSGSSSGGGYTERVVQHASGKYDVIGADDGRTYRGVPWLGVPRTGYVARPALVAETGGELIISAADLARLRTHVNYPSVLKAIEESRSGRVPQHAGGAYGSLPSPQSSPSSSDATASELLAAVVRIEALFSQLPRSQRSYVLFDDLNAAQELSYRSSHPFTRTDKS